MFTHTNNNKNYVAVLTKAEYDLIIYTIETFNNNGDLINTHLFVTNRQIVEDRTIEVIMQEWFAMLITLV